MSNEIRPSYYVKVIYKKKFGEYEDQFFKVFKVENSNFLEELPAWIDREVYEAETYNDIDYDNREILSDTDTMAPFQPFWVNSEMVVSFQYAEQISKSDYDVLVRYI